MKNILTKLTENAGRSLSHRNVNKVEEITEGRAMSVDKVMKQLEENGVYTKALHIWNLFEAMRKDNQEMYEQLLEYITTSPALKKILDAEKTRDEKDRERYIKASNKRAGYHYVSDGCGNRRLEYHC